MPEPVPTSATLLPLRSKSRQESREERAGQKVSGVEDHWPDDEAEPRDARVGSSSAIEDEMIREEVNG
jgi:hypothetical protein